MFYTSSDWVGWYTSIFSLSCLCAVSTWSVWTDRGDSLQPNMLIFIPLWCLVVRQTFVLLCSINITMNIYEISTHVHAQRAFIIVYPYTVIANLLTQLLYKWPFVFHTEVKINMCWMFHQSGEQIIWKYVIPHAIIIMSAHMRFFYNTSYETCLYIQKRCICIPFYFYVYLLLERLKGFFFKFRKMTV